MLLCDCAMRLRLGLSVARDLNLMFVEGSPHISRAPQDIGKGTERIACCLVIKECIRERVRLALSQEDCLEGVLLSPLSSGFATQPLRLVMRRRPAHGGPSFPSAQVWLEVSVVPNPHPPKPRLQSRTRPDTACHFGVQVWEAPSRRSSLPLAYLGLGFRADELGMVGAN